VTRVAPLFFKARFVGACLKDPKCSVLACSYFSRQVLSQSPLVTAIGQDGQPMAYAPPSFVHWMIKWRIFVIVIKQGSKPRYFIGFLFRTNPF